MKLKYFTLAMAFAMALVLAGCTANRDDNSAAPVPPTHTVSGDQNDRNSPEVGSGSQNDVNGGDTQNSPGMGGAQNSTGVDGTGASDDVGQNNGRSGVRSRSGVGNAIDNIGEAAGDLARGAGNAVQDAGNAIGNAVGDVGRAVR